MHMIARSLLASRANSKIRSEVGAYVKFEKKNMLVLLTQKWYFLDNDAIYDVIMQKTG